MIHFTTKVRRPVVTFGCVAVAVFVSAPLNAQTEAPGERVVVGLKYDGPIKDVYQVTADTTKDGVSKGLTDLKAIYDGYVRAGVNSADLSMTAVFHSKASSHLLTDEAWNNHNKTSDGNPNNALNAELVRRGINLELCDLARTGNNWAKSDIHPDVTLVGNAYHRLSELQTQGYIYVKFCQHKLHFRINNETAVLSKEHLMQSSPPTKCSVAVRIAGGSTGISAFCSSAIWCGYDVYTS